MFIGETDNESIIQLHSTLSLSHSDAFAYPQQGLNTHHAKSPTKYKPLLVPSI